MGFWISFFFLFSNRFGWILPLFWFGLDDWKMMILFHLFNPPWNKHSHLKMLVYRSVNVSVTWCFKAYFTLKTCFHWCHCPQTWGRRDSQMDAFPSNLQMRPRKKWGGGGRCNPNFGKSFFRGCTNLCNLGWWAYRWLATDGITTAKDIAGSKDLCINPWPDAVPTGFNILVFLKICQWIHRNCVMAKWFMGGKMTQHDVFWILPNRMLDKWSSPPTWSTWIIMTAKTGESLIRIKG